MLILALPHVFHTSSASCWISGEIFPVRTLLNNDTLRLTSPTGPTSSQHSHRIFPLCHHSGDQLLFFVGIKSHSTKHGLGHLPSIESAGRDPESLPLTSSQPPLFFQWRPTGCPDEDSDYWESRYCLPLRCLSTYAGTTFCHNFWEHDFLRCMRK